MRCDDPAAFRAPCGCWQQPGRRAALGALAALGLAPLAARAADGTSYDAMLVNCIDPRFVRGCNSWMGEHGMAGRYSHFVVAGGPIGAVDPRFEAWHAAFRDNLDITVQLHHIRRVVAFTHRDCGAAKLAFGEAAVATPAAEEAAHAGALRMFRAAVSERHPELTVVTGIMDLRGHVLPVA